VQALNHEAACRIYRDALRTEQGDSLRGDREIQALGTLIDLADDLGREYGLVRALTWAERIVVRTETPAFARGLVHYFAANAWSGLRHLRRQGAARLEWEQPEYEREIAHLRHAKKQLDGSRDISRRCQVLTNLGNALDSRGRLVEAIAEWDAALQLDATFAMALGNRGMGFGWYGRVCYDPGHRLYLVRAALEGLTAALAKGGGQMMPDARQAFANYKQRIERGFAGSLRRKPRRSVRRRRWTKAETAYRRWCAHQRLFLNDLNDLGPSEIGMADVLTLPDHVTPLDEGPTLIGFFNQLKQEFAAARWLAYEGLMSDRVHFADRDVTLINTLDYPAYSLRAEQVKLAFRSTYSLFDKIAFFLNDYFALNIPERLVTLRTLSYDGKPSDRRLRPGLEGTQNLFLQALFWLSKDFFEPEMSVEQEMEPRSERTASVRNELEHKYLKLHEILVGRPKGRVKKSSFDHDRLAYSMSRSDFEDETLALLRRGRSALIYLTFAVRVEEARKEVERGKKGVLTMPVLTDAWEDDWKR